MSKRKTKHIVGSLGMIGAGMVMGVMHAEAQIAGSSNIPLKATNSTNCALTVTPSGNGVTLNITTGASNVNVGNYSALCNDEAGYYVQVATGTGGQPYLKGAVNSQTLGYTVQYGATTLGFTSGVATATSAGTYTPAASTATIGVSFAATPTLSPDTYTDTLTFTLYTN